MRHLLFFILGATLLVTYAQARPISYPGGWTVMSMNDGDKNTLHIHYSPTIKTSLGYKIEHWRDREFTLNAIQVNKLIKRWNKQNSQANLYLKSGLGFAYSDNGSFNHEFEPSGFVGIAGDWETRRLFASYQNRYTEADGISISLFKARIGVAPYQGDYGDLHTWFMLQVEHSSENEDEFIITPLVRLFKNVHLLEIGVNNNEEVLFNYIIRF